MSQSLYRFFSLNDNSLNSLENLYLYFSKLKDFNDPFEGTQSRMLMEPKISDLTDGDFIKLQRFLLKGQQADIEEKLIKLFMHGGKEHINEVKQGYLNDLYGIFIDNYETVNEDYFCCFAQDKYCSALKNKLMWSHYSDGMRGFCIEFDKSKLIDSLSKKNNQLIGMIPITYSDFYKVNIVDSALEIMSNHENGTRLISKASNAITVKPKEWEYENEFRLQLNNNFGYFDLECIKSITFGFKADTSKVQQIIKSLSSSNIKFQLAKLADDSFDIDLTSYTI